MSSWEDLEPIYGELPIFHSGLRAMIAIGTFVHYSGEKVGHLITRVSEGYVANDGVLVNEFPLVRMSSIRIQLDPSAVHHEVYQSHSAEQIPVEAIEGVAWVFLPRQTREARYRLGDGVDNIFLLRFRENLEEYSTFPFADLSPQYSLCQDSYSMIIFRDLQAIGDLADKILNREGQLQGHFHRSIGETTIGPPTFHFLRSKIGPSFRRTKRQLFRCRTDSGLVTKAVAEKEKWTLFRFETSSQLDTLFSIFGPTIMVGNRTKRPRVGTAYIPNFGTRINVVSGVTVRSTGVSTRNTGVDLLTNGRLLRLIVRYERTQQGDTDGPYGKSVLMNRTRMHRLIDKNRPVPMSGTGPIAGQSETVPAHLLN
jgi:hypothetical protein